MYIPLSVGQKLVEPSIKRAASSEIHPFKSACGTVEGIRIGLTFWNELAYVAFQNMEKGQRIYVSGRLVSDVVNQDDDKPQAYYKRNSKYPDFNHKDTEEALGIEGRNNPSWVESQLASFADIHSQLYVAMNLAATQ
ncbi:hypothetical protein EJ110_NYTH43582 [Nymphaea thermarum]|nr:hypothetical protein EJ110_NYTH43582 [Nymphaea thermarum]